MELNILYIECDVPAGQTLGEWRRQHAHHDAHRSARRTLRRLVRRIGR